MFDISYSFWENYLFIPGSLRLLSHKPQKPTLVNLAEKELIEALRLSRRASALSLGFLQPGSVPKVLPRDRHLEFTTGHRPRELLLSQQPHLGWQAHPVHALLQVSSLYETRTGANNWQTWAADAYTHRTWDHTGDWEKASWFSIERACVSRGGEFCKQMDLKSCVAVLVSLCCFN